MQEGVIRALLDAFDASDWQEMEVTIGEDQLRLSRQAAANGRPAAGPAVGQHSAGPAQAAREDASEREREGGAALGDSAPPDAAAREAKVERGDREAARNGSVQGEPVRSPSVGLFWRAPSPGAPPFVDVGSAVQAGDTVGIVEVMKLMNHVIAPVAGVVSAILAENGAAVEYGETLVAIDASS
jgi:acetyl-CoA carboxylase biotin carboxyl carrier protein